MTADPLTPQARVAEGVGLQLAQVAMSPRAARLLAEIEQLRSQAARAEEEVGRLSTALARSAHPSLPAIAGCAANDAIARCSLQLPWFGLPSQMKAWCRQNTWPSLSQPQQTLCIAAAIKLSQPVRVLAEEGSGLSVFCESRSRKSGEDGGRRGGGCSCIGRTQQVPYS